MRRYRGILKENGVFLFLITLWSFELYELKYDLIIVTCGNQPHDLLLTFSSFLNVASIFFFLLQIEYQNGSLLFSHQ